MDIVLRDGSDRFNFRAAAVLLQQGCLLVHQVDGFDFWFLPGGRVQMMESMEDALRRELREELEVKISIKRLLWIVENFFPSSDGFYHEFCGYFLCECLPGQREIPLEGSWKESKLTFRWVPLGELSSLPLVPTFLKSAVKELPIHPIHMVLKEG